MHVTMIGAGNMGLALAKYLAKANHRVVIGLRDEEKAKRLADEIGLSVMGASIPDAVSRSDIVFLAVPHASMDDALKSTGPMDGKTVVDVSNCFTSDFTNLTLGHTTSAAEEIAKQIPRAKVVKAFNTIFATILQKGLKFDNQILNVFVSGDDEPAKDTVCNLIQSIGLQSVDCGGLKSARFLEPLAALTLQVDFHLNRDVQIAPVMIERALPA